METFISRIALPATHFHHIRGFDTVIYIRIQQQSLAQMICPLPEIFSNFRPAHHLLINVSNIAIQFFYLSIVYTYIPAIEVRSDIMSANEIKLIELDSHSDSSCISAWINLKFSFKILVTPFVGSQTCEKHIALNTLIITSTKLFSIRHNTRYKVS